MLISSSVRVSAHKKCADEVKKEIEWCIDNIEEKFGAELQKQYNRMSPVKSKKLSFEDVFNNAKNLLQDNKIKVLMMNGKSDVESSEYSEGCNFIVGGNTLGRGVTFPSLQTIYYTRTSKNPQADTMWQHSRMFGYDRDPGMMMIYIDENLYKLFSDINATNNSIIAQVESGIDNVKVYYPEGLNPTRKNVLDNDHICILSGELIIILLIWIMTQLKKFPNSLALFQNRKNIIKLVSG